MYLILSTTYSGRRDLILSPLESPKCLLYRDNHLSTQLQKLLSVEHFLIFFAGFAFLEKMEIDLPESAEIRELSDSM